MDIELISVIVPIYKTEQYLARCVNSILTQTYKNIEIILVDDGSPDNSPKICDEFAEKHTNIRVIHKENGGLSSARNRGIDLAKGEYISFVDSDDFIDPEMLKRLYLSIKKHNADLAMVKYAEMNEHQKPPIVSEVSETVYRKKDIEKMFLKLKIESACVILYSRKAINKNRFPLGKTSEDIIFNFSVFRQIDSFVLIPEKRYYYLYHSESISHGSLNKNMLTYLYIRKKIYNYYRRENQVELTGLAEVLYARAAMGLLARMAIYGISKELNEKTWKYRLTKILRKHKDVFFESEDVPFSRKMLGFCCLYLYPLLSLTRGCKR